MFFLFSFPPIKTRRKRQFRFPVGNGFFEKKQKKTKTKKDWLPSLMMMLRSLLLLLASLAGTHALTMSASKNVLIIGGTRFSGLYLWKE